MGFLYVRDRSKTKKRKPTAKQRELSASWDAIMKKYDAKPVPTTAKSSVHVKPFVRETKHYPSLNSGHHDTAAKPAKVYTGTKMLGIGTMHKSNSVPIFSNEEAVQIATMRRN